MERTGAMTPRTTLRLPLRLPLRRAATSSVPRTWAVRAVAGILAATVAGAGWLWVRDSPLASVQQIRIDGVRGVDAAAIDAALRGAAKGMTTLDVNAGALRAAVAPYIVVRGVSATGSFPHRLTIRVEEQLPVAVLTAGGVRTAAAGDGVVLGPGLVSSTLPTIALAGAAPGRGGHVLDGAARAELGVLGAAPRELIGWIARVFTEGREGLTVAMRNGLVVYFGDAERPHAKWISALRVLTDSHSAGATYVDVRAPERPAAGTSAVGTSAAGTAGTGGLGEGSEASAQVSATDPTAAALAKILAEAIGGGPNAAAQPAATTTTPQAAAPQGSTGEPAQTVAPQATTAEPAPAAAPQAGTGEPAPAASPQATPQAAAPTEEPSVSTSG
jgi:cell division protein FtsQ